MDEEIYHLYHREGDDWWWSAGRRALVHSLWRGFAPVLPERPRILELGCGTGGLLQELSGWAEAHGIDLSTEAVDYCRRRGLRNVCQGSLNALPYRDGSFEGLIAVDVLEHLNDDAGALSEMLRVCRPGGILIATVPAYQFLWSRRDEQLHHKRRYTLRELRRRIAAAGFLPIKSTYVNPHLFLPLIALVALGHIKKEGHNLKLDYGLVPGPMNRLITSIVRAESRLIAHFSLPVGTSIACVAVKPR